MTANSRLLWCAVIIIISALYAVLVAQDKNLASAVSSGYVAILLTVILVTHFWKKP